MFSWSKKKDTKRRSRPDRDSEENEFGVKIDRGQDDKQLEAELKRLAGIDSLPEEDNLNEGEEDEEAELLRLLGGSKGKAVKKPAAAAGAVEELGDISVLTGDIDLGDEDVEVDENDPELLGELLELTNPDDGILEETEDVESDSEPEGKPSGGEDDILTVLKERLKMYKTAEAKAKENNESSRARRFSRGIKTLEDLLKKAKAGKAVSPDDIPPVIALNLKPAPPSQAEIPENIEDSPEGHLQQINGNVQETSEPENILKTLTDRLKMYQTAEAKSKEAGETTRARRFNRGTKTLEGLIKQAQAGRPVAPEDIPPQVALNLKPAPPPPPEPSEDAVSDNCEGIEDEISNINLASPSDEPEPQSEQEQERNIMDVLSERLEMYKTAEAKAKELGEATRARRFGRGIKTIQGLIRQATGGTPIAHDDIPPVIALNLKPPPPVVLQAEELPESVPVERENLARSSDTSEKPLSFTAVEDVDLDELTEETPTTVLEGLEQRVRLYSKFQEKAKAEGDMALASQNERIVRVYQSAITTFKSGHYIDVLSLPNPNGCPPIPIPFFVPGRKRNF